MQQTLFDCFDNNQNEKAEEVVIVPEVKKPVIELRDYQKEAVKAFKIGIANGHRSGVLCAPTGSGKTVIIAQICCDFVEKMNKRIIVCTHRKELILQDEALLNKMNPNIKTGVISAMCGRKEFGNNVTFAGIMTLVRNIEKLEKTDLFIIDEAHRVNPDENTSYAKVIGALKEKNPNLVVLGLSATPYRLKQGLLYEGDDRLFDCLYYDIGMRYLIEHNYLSPVVSRGSSKKINLKGVHTKMGDFNAEELEKVADDEQLTKHAVDEICEFGKDRKSWIIFTTGVRHANHVYEKLVEKGISLAIVTGETNVKERAQILADYKSEKIRCLINVNVLTEGFDAPQTDMVVLLMATMSPAKFVQAVGRGMRICEGKKDCLVLDYGSNTVRLGTIDSIRPPSKAEKSNKDPKCKECPSCHAFIPLNAKTCNVCGYEYPSKERKLNHDLKAFDGNIVSKPEWLRVIKAVYERHKGRDGKPDTLRCKYLCENKMWYSTYLSLDKVRAKPFAYDKSLKYVRLCGGFATTIEEALHEIQNNRWKLPYKIYIESKNGFNTMTNYQF